MREIEKEEDSAREERRVTGCQPRMQSILGRIKETVCDSSSSRLRPAYSTRTALCICATAEIQDRKYGCKWGISTFILGSWGRLLTSVARKQSAQTDEFDLSWAVKSDHNY